MKHERLKTAVEHSQDANLLYDYRREILELLSDLEEEQARVSRLTRENEEALARIDTLTNRANTAEALVAEWQKAAFSACAGIVSTPATAGRDQSMHLSHLADLRARTVALGVALALERQQARVADLTRAALDRQSPFDDQIVFTQDFEPGAKDAE